MGKVLHFRNSILNFCKIYPAAVICLALFNGIIPLISCEETSRAMLLFFSLAITLPTLTVSLKISAKFAIFTFIGWLTAVFALSPPAGDYTHIVGGRNCGAEIRAEICDPLVPGKTVSWLPMPAVVQGKVLSMRYSQTDRWRPVSGTVGLKFPRDLTGIPFGEVLEIEGAFIEPESPLFPGGFDYKKYLLSKGIQKIFVVENCRVLNPGQPDPSWLLRGQRNVLKIRDFVMNGMVEGMNLKQQRMMAAILFGCRQGLNYDSRKEYMQSGVMHIFAISGLHVGMLALALYLGFCWVPFRIRHLLIPLVLFFYVYTTGMQASALRALLMISIWSVHRSALRPVAPLNVIFLAAAIVILLNPLTILGAGFQYSFTIAGFLVLSWNSVKRWFAYLEEKNLWDPAYGTGLKFYCHRLRNMSLNSLICCLISWLASSGLNLAHHNFFIPGALFTNFLILPFVWLLFLTAAFEILLFPLRNLLGLGYIIRGLLNIINELSFLGSISGQGLYLPAPPYWLIVIFFIALGVMITATRKKMFYIGVGLVAANIAWWCCQVPCLNNRTTLTVFQGGESQTPALVSMSPGNKTVTVINTGTVQTAKYLLDYLTGNGVNTIDTLCFSKAGRHACSGAWMIFSRFRVRQAVFPENFRQSRYARAAMKAAEASGAYIDFIPSAQDDGTADFNRPEFRCRTQGEDWEFKSALPESKTSVTIRQNSPGEQELNIRINSGEQHSLNLVNSNFISLHEIKSGK